MKRSISWLALFDVLLAVGCFAYLSYRDRNRSSRRRSEEKLDESLAETFPASDPLPY
jgi:hypothetical protein